MIHEKFCGLSGEYTFRKLADVPSEKEIKKERIIGFISGLFASIIATGIIWGCLEIIKFLIKK